MAPPRPPADLPPPGRAHDPNAIAGYDDHGLYLATRDDAFRIGVSAWLQARWELDVAGDNSTAQRFSVPVGRVLIGGHAFATTDFLISVDGAGGTLALLDAYIDQPVAMLGARLRAGQFKPWFSQQQITDRVYLEFTDRPLTAAFAGIGRDLGASLYHEPDIATGGVEWALGVFDGTGIAPREDCTTIAECPPATNVPVDGEPLATLRVGWSSAHADPYHEGDLDGGPPRVALGVGYAVDLAGAHGDRMVHDVTGDVVFKANGLALTTAVFVKSAPSPTGRTTDVGFHAQLGYMIVPTLLGLAGRYAQVPIGDATAQEVLGVLDIYRHGHALKLQLEGGGEHVTGTDAIGWIAQIQTQLLL